MTKISKIDRIAELQELKDFFSKAKMPTGAIQLNSFCKIVDSAKFLESHFATAESQMNNETLDSFIERLREFKAYLVNNSKPKKAKK